MPEVEEDRGGGRRSSVTEVTFNTMRFQKGLGSNIIDDFVPKNLRPMLSKCVIDASLCRAFITIGIDNTRNDVNLGKGCPKFKTLVPVSYRGSGAHLVAVNVLVLLTHLRNNRFAMLRQKKVIFGGEGIMVNDIDTGGGRSEGRRLLNGDMGASSRGGCNKGSGKFKVLFPNDSG